MSTKHTPSSTVRASSATADLAYVAVFTALVIVLGFVAIPVGIAGVPILLQNTAVILAALILGPRRGFYVTGLFLLIGMFLPVLAGGRTTIFSLGSPTVGYVLSYLIAVPVAGFIATRGARTSKGVATALFAVAGFVGLLIQYVMGATGLMVQTGLGFGEAAQAQLIFIPTDSLEMIVMVAIAVGVHSAFPQLLRAEAR
ncbi:biotin transporter BioY [Corynebacterium timonense]|uniref:Biotin transporter n=1 Tax=Corynebacterium timonense TaxID=441500 RepID=A0A1H1N7Q3_9CORY|nr:biotin transporter BioY [Corynebacterium timonense]SDR95004.1 biotin transport system substrate-specific component [Corynebacterium timonense]